MMLLIVMLTALLGQVESKDGVQKRDSKLTGWTMRPFLDQFLGLVKQEAALPPANVCGYLYGDETNPIDCSPGVCGYNTDLDIFMCCSSTTVSGGSTYPVGCPTYTACVPYSTTNTCVDTAICSSDYKTMCDPDYPYCAAATIAGVPGLSLTDWACLKAATTIAVYLSPVSGVSSGASSNPASSTGVSSGASSGASSVASSATSKTTAASPSSLPSIVSSTTVVKTTATGTTGPGAVTITSTSATKAPTSLAASQSINTVNSNGAVSSYENRLGYIICGLVGAVVGLYL